MLKRPNERPVPGPPQRRKAGRIRIEPLWTNIGEVTDLSATGMRIRCWIRPRRNRPFRITLRGFELPGPLWGVMIWSKKIGLLRHEIGVRFENPCPEVVRHLRAIAGGSGFKMLKDEQHQQAA